MTPQAAAARSRLLYAVDAAQHQFADTCETDAIAAHELTLLSLLASDVAMTLRRWKGAIRALDAQRASWPTDAGAYVVESLFDGVLEPEATRVLTALLRAEGV